jgi:hypothetical protein
LTHPKERTLFGHFQDQTSVKNLRRENPGRLLDRSTHLKGLSDEIYTGIFCLEWVYLGLNGNRLWFLNFKEGSSILDGYFKY